MTRRERIVVLLENYMDVEHGIQDASPGQDVFVPQMCAAWRHPSYIELRRLLPLLRDSEPFIYWHLAETYFRYHVSRVLVCPGNVRNGREEKPCDYWVPLYSRTAVHRHGHGKTFSLVSGIRKRVSAAVDEAQVAQGVDWIERHFQGEPFIPDELLALAA